MKKKEFEDFKDFVYGIIKEYGRSIADINDQLKHIKLKLNKIDSLLFEVDLIIRAIDIIKTSLKQVLPTEMQDFLKLI